MIIISAAGLHCATQDDVKVIGRSFPRVLDTCAVFHRVMRSELATATEVQKAKDLYATAAQLGFRFSDNVRTYFSEAGHETA